MVLNNTLQPYLLTFKSIDTMIKGLLVGEFLQEAEKTRKLLAAIPDSMLAFKTLGILVDNSAVSNIRALRLRRRSLPGFIRN
jgi:ABC-type uncharacterized transport system permease subunit